MAGKHSHLNLVDTVIFCFAGIVGVMAAGLTIFAEQSHDEAVIMPLFYPLMPGLISGILITGVHGGTATEEKVATIVAALTNAAFYAFLIIAARWIWRTLIARPTAYAHNSQNER